MLKLTLATSSGSPCKILCLGSHCDDIEIGCGGTLLKLSQQLPQVELYWAAVFSSGQVRAREARETAAHMEHISKPPILEYEVPNYDGDLGTPNVFTHLDESICRRKIEYLGTHFKSQPHKHWFDEGAFWALLRLRGIEAHAPSKYAEAFYCRKSVLD